MGKPSVSQISVVAAPESRGSRVNETSSFFEALSNLCPVVLHCSFFEFFVERVYLIIR